MGGKAKQQKGQGAECKAAPAYAKAPAGRKGI